MKTRISLILAVLAVLVAVAAAAFLLSHSFTGSSDLAVKVFEKGLPKGEAIAVKTRAGRFGVQMGDAFSYLLEVWYDPAQVLAIDRASLDKGVNLEPFEIRDTKETEFDFDSTTRVYRREYELQLITGQVEHLYTFPSLVVRYSLKGSEGLLDKTVAPEPVYVAPRLPADITSLDLGAGPGYGPLRPVKGEIEDVGQTRLPWILWVLGGFLAALGMANLGLRVIPQWKEMAKQRRKVDVLSEAYRSLCENVAMAVEPRRLLHQMDHILRVILAREEKSDWLEEPNLDLLSSGIREPVISLFEKCQKTYEPEVIEQKEAEEALRQLEGILDSYYGEGERAAWRS